MNTLKTNLICTNIYIFYKKSALHVKYTTVNSTVTNTSKSQSAQFIIVYQLNEFFPELL